MINRRPNTNPFGSITSLLVMAAVIVGLFFLAKGVFTLLAWAAPALLIITLILDYNIILDFGAWLVKLIKTNPLNGIIAVLFIVFAFPLVAGFLFSKAILKRQGKGMKRIFEEQQKAANQNTAFDSNIEDIEYEELDIDDIPEKSEKDYRDLFK